MPRFFVKDIDIHSGIINVTGDDVGHIKKVLRLNIGDSITISDGRGNDYLVEIARFGPDYIHTVIVNSKRNDTEPPLDITLFQGIPKSDKMDFIIQKSVELGVKKIVPVITERTIVRIDSKKDVESKVARWQRIALEAAKQSNRGIVPQVGLPLTFAKALEALEETQLSVIPYEKETKNGLKACIQKTDIKKIAVIIGPEGGFTEAEIEKAELSGAVPISLGPRILRTETAGIAVLSMLMYELGDVG